MKNLIPFFLLFVLFVSHHLVYAQWTIYNTSNSGLPDNSVRGIVKDLSGNLWMATYGGGIANFDGVNWTVFNSSNSSLPHNVCYDIAIEGNIIWVATVNGVAKFDGSGWTIFNSFNSGLPCNYVTSIFIDGIGNKWFSSLCPPTLQGGGLTKFDGLNWTTYNLVNSGIANNKINSIAEDIQGNLWVAHMDWDPDDPDPYSGGISRFDGVSFIVYDTSNTTMPSNLIRGISVSPFTNEIWATSDKGLILFDGINWTIFDTTNSGLPSNSTSSKVAFDNNGNYWVSTPKSLSVLTNNGNWIVYDSTNSVFTTGSVRSILIVIPIVWLGTSGGLIRFDTSVGITENVNTEFQTSIYPNPTSGKIYLNSELKMDRYQVFDMLGKLILKGTVYDAVIDVSPLKNGIYFIHLTDGKNEKIARVKITKFEE